MSSTLLSIICCSSHSKNYRCCFNTFRITSGAIIVCVVESLAACVGMLVSGYQLRAVDRDESDPEPIIAILTVIVYLITLFGLSRGLKAEKPKWILPHLIFQILCILALFIRAGIIVVFVGIGVVATDIWLITGFIVFLLAALVEIWFFLIVQSCYHFLREQEAYKESLQSHTVLS